MLHSANRRFSIQFELHRLSAQAHSGWISYSLTLRTQNDAFALVSTADEPLFLDCEVEPEIPAFCCGIRSVIERGGTYCFEPIDDRDFAFLITVDDSSCIIKITMADKPIPARFGWSSGARVEAPDLLRFADELEANYASLLQRNDHDD